MKKCFIIIKTIKMLNRCTDLCYANCAIGKLVWASFFCFLVVHDLIFVIIRKPEYYVTVYIVRQINQN